MSHQNTLYMTIICMHARHGEINNGEEKEKLIVKFLLPAPRVLRDSVEMLLHYSPANSAGVPMAEPQEVQQSVKSTGRNHHGSHKQRKIY